MNAHRPWMRRPGRMAGAFALIVGWMLQPALPALADPLGLSGVWSSFAIPNAPPNRTEHMAAFDPVGNRLVVFGGNFGSNDTWFVHLEGLQWWESLALDVRPSPRKSGVLLHDPVRHRMLLIGGVNGSYMSDVWALSLSGTPGWLPVAVVGPSPPGRHFSAGVYDPIGDRIVLVGGYAGNGPGLDDVWALHLASVPYWEQLQPAGEILPPRYGHAAVYNPGSDAVIVWGGSNEPDVWELRLRPTPEWRRMAPSTTGPGIVRYTGAVMDAGRNRMIVVGGYGGERLDAGWEFLFDPIPSWAPLDPAGTIPPLRYLHQTVFREETGEVLCWGGTPVTSPDVVSLAFGPAVGAPGLVTFQPRGGLEGVEVTILGWGLDQASSVDFNGVPAPILSAEWASLVTRVPAGATTGPIRVVNPNGESYSASPFIVGPPPEVHSFSPDSVRVDDTLSVRGRHLTHVERLRIGGRDAGAFTVESDSLITLVVPGGLLTGYIHVIGPTGEGFSAEAVRLLSPDPYPRIVSVRDVRNDQGGRVLIRWRRSEADGVYSAGVNRYRVWRRAPDAGPRAAAPAGATRIGADYWEPVGEIPAARLTGYAYTAGTHQDSLPGDNPLAAFMVQAVSDTSGISYFSGVATGYSVDNLAPAQPLPFAAVYGPASVALHWTESREPDFRTFRLYSGTSPAFVPSPASLLAETTDTSYVDARPGAVSSCYKLAAVDVHGNQGRFVLVTPSGPTAALAALLSVEASPDVVRLTWAAIATSSLRATVERAVAGGGWSAVGIVVADGEGYLRFEDRDVTPGTSYGYRLVIADDDSEQVAGETSVTVPVRVFELHSVAPNPSRGGMVEVAYSVPTLEPVRLELFDVAGRRVGAWSPVATAVGRQRFQLGPGNAWRSGVYVLRLTQSGSVRRARLVLQD